jgi:hypothetical protein
LIDSSANVSLIILSVAVWYLGMLDAAGAEFAMPSSPSSQELVNFILSSGIAAASYLTYRARVLMASSRA